MGILNVLIACEESQALCVAFRELGHRAFSCDLQDCSGGYPEYHIRGDALSIAGGNCQFTTQDGVTHHVSGKWDLIIAHPPCTHLCISGAKHFEAKREDGRQYEAIDTFCKFYNVDCDHVCIENPVNIISSDYAARYFPELNEKWSLPYIPSCSIQPYEHGDPYRKKTMLWLKGLPSLVPTDIVEPKLYTFKRKDGREITFSADYGGSYCNSGKKRSKTYIGISKAMASQWSAYLLKLTIHN